MNDSDRDYAWRYFELHATQRLTTFHFYIVTATLVATGLLASFHKDFRAPILGVFLGLLLALLSFVFWKLDQRNRLLIVNAETALKHLEVVAASADAGGNGAKLAMLFSRDDQHFGALNKSCSRWFWNAHYSYRQCFQAIFLCFGGLGVLGALVALRYAI